jgi:alkylation response protein AidB-like acyl-CoA dehydrogenase
MATTNAVATAKRVKGGSFLTEERNRKTFSRRRISPKNNGKSPRPPSSSPPTKWFPAAAEIEAKNFAVTRNLLRKAGDLGLMAVDVPEAYGGLELDKVTSAIVAESMSQLASFSVAFSAHAGIGTLPLVWYGTEAQKQKYLPSWRPANGSPPMRCRNRHRAPTP